MAIISLIFCLSSFLLSAQELKNTLTLEFLPAYGMFALSGGGAGLGYERSLSDWLALRGSLALGGVPAENEGTILFGSFYGDVVISPFSLVRGLRFAVGGGLMYLGAFGEQEQGGLEAHFWIPYFKGSVGWRFLIGKKRLRISVEPKLTAALTFPGPTGSGPDGELEWYSSGYFMALVYPNLSLGVSF